ncbi:MAG TPA: HupE/UreJ family protein [Gammaproteobacteria bacterium]|nr:HupE/UreJ family protein [Gammaproteobacteria bacterium]
MSPKAVYTSLLTLLCLLLAPLAQAHTGTHMAGSGLLAGFAHPLTGLDHLLIAVAAGYWAARAGNHGVRDMALFLGLLLAGMLLGLAALAYPALGIETLLALLLTAAVIAVAIAVPEKFAYVFFGSFALYHGLAHLLEMPHQVMVAGYMTGLLISTGLLLALGGLLRHVVITRKPNAGG